MSVSIDGYNAREQGSRDWRMLIVAGSVWGSMLAAYEMHERLHPHDGVRKAVGSQTGDGVPTWLAPVILAALVTGLVLAYCMYAGGQSVACKQALLRHIRPWRHCRSVMRTVQRRPATAFMQHGRLRAALWVLVLMFSNGSGVLAVALDTTVRERDPAIIAADAQDAGSGSMRVVARVEAPVVASKSRQADCQAKTRLEQVDDGVQSNSAMPATLYMSGDACTTVSWGERVAVSGSLQRAQYGAEPIWIRADDTAAVHVIREAPLWRRGINAMQQAFSEASSGLSPQGRVLVPGLTIGVLGQDFIGRTDDKHGESVNATFAAMLEEHFKSSGIMHLMAVSGGHFALVLGLVRRWCARLLLPRVLVALCCACAYGMLAMMVYPSDSVRRALIMGLVEALATAVGRRSQTVSALGLTVIAVLFADPPMARSFGFALSCASVLGISMLGQPLARHLGNIMPAVLAEASATTVAAQCFSLPVQVMMTPQVPLLSVVANLIVAPFVDFATMTGLASLACAWCCMPLGFALAWVSSCGTAVMQWCADTVGASQMAVVPWPEGGRGALLVLALECAVVLWWNVCIKCAAMCHVVMQRKKTANLPLVGESAWEPFDPPAGMIKTDSGRTPVMSTARDGTVPTSVLSDEVWDTGERLHIGAVEKLRGWCVQTRVMLEQRGWVS